MRNTVLGVIVFIFLFNGLRVYAGPPASCLLFSLTEQNQIRLGIINTSEKNLNFKITGPDGRVVFARKVTDGTNYFQVLDLSNLADGKYSARLTGHELEFEREFSVESSKIVLLDRKIEYQPLFKLLGNQTLLITYPNTGRNVVSVFFERNNKTVFEDKNITSTAFGKRYSLGGMLKGDYMVTLQSGTKKYSYSLQIK